MSSSNEKNAMALALLRRAGTAPVMSLVKVGAGLEMSSAITRMVLKNIHLAIMSRKEEEVVVLNSTGNSYAPEQREGAEPVLKWVRVAMKPPVTKETNNEWDETVSWEANSEKWQGGLTSGKKKNKSSQPAFILREVPYDDWRKHYAKDKHGRYRGTEAPAENCILLPEDEIKWRSEPLHNEAEKSTQSEDASPPLEQLERSTSLPEYQEVDPVPSLQTEQDPAVPTQKEEAIFIEADGHTGSRIVEEPKAGFTLPTSPTSPTSPEPPSSPTSPGNKKSWRDRVGSSTKFSIMGRSSSARDIR